MIEQIVLSCEALGPCAVVRARGEEAINALPRFTVDVLHPDPQVDFDAVIRAPATLAFGDEDGGARSVALLVAEIAYDGPHRDGHRYRVVLATAAHVLTLRSGYRVFQDKTTEEIVTDVLRDARISGKMVSFRLGGRYRKRVYCVQYGEVDWSFVERLLADDGISYWLEETDGVPALVFGDGPSAHAPIDGEKTVRFEEPSGMTRTHASLFELEKTIEMAPTRVHVREYDVRRPDRLIEGAAGEGALEHFEYPAAVPHAEAATALAEVRLDQLRRQAVQARGCSACARLAPGRVVTIEGAHDDGIDGDYLITEVRHAISQASRNEAEGRPYANEIELVPHGDRAFRPAIPRNAPKVSGIETAIVTGPPGEEIHVDDLGCIKLRFPWDRSGIDDDRSSLWVRELQMPMQGSMLLPRVGWEVPVAYVDGSPDRPFVLGRLYNGASPVPYVLPSKKATSTLQSATSPSDGSTNEIRFADDAGGMETYVHATMNQTITVGGSATTTVGVTETHDVKKSSGLHAATQTITVAGKQTFVVGADAGVKIKGARTETIAAMERTGVIATRIVDCAGSYHELVGGLYALQCNTASTAVQGAYLQAIGGSAAYISGLGVHQSAAGGRSEAVSGSKAIVASSAFAESTKGLKKISAGAVTLDGAGGVFTNAASAAISVGGSATISAGGTLVFDARSITITAGGGITASGGSTLTMKGKLGASGGKTKVDAGTFEKAGDAKASS